MKKGLMILAILAVSTGAYAESIKLEDTVVTTGESFGTSVRDTAKDITVVTSKEIEDKGAKTVAEALKGVPGVIIKNMDGAAPNIDLRGSGATAGNNTVILLDGIPMSGMATFDINQIPIGEVDRIEVIQGGGAVMYGDGAIGGVVNIITKAPENKKNYGSVGAEYGSWKTARTNVNYGTKIGKFLLNTSYSGYQSLDYRDRNEEFKNKKDKRDSIWLRGKYDLKDGSIEARYSHNEAKDYYSYYLEESDFKNNPKKAGSGGNLSHEISDIWNLSFNKKLTDNLDFLIYGGYYKEKNKTLNTITDEYYIKPQFKYTYAKDSYLILGGDYRKGTREFKDMIYLNGKNQKAPDDERKSYAGYIMNKTTLGKWQFTQGYRREKVKYKYSQKEYDNSWNLVGVTPMAADYSNNDSYELGINYLYSDTGNAYLSYTRANRTPTIDDAGAWSGSVATQKNDIYELGLRDYYGITTIGASIFYIKSENEIYYDKTDSNNSTNRNFDGKVERKGAQLSLQHYFDKLILRENISYIDAEITSGVYDGNTFAGVPKWTVNLGATYNFTERFLANVDMYYQSDMYAQDDFDNYFDKENDYVTVDMNFSYKFDTGLEIYAGVRNLFDKEYANTIISTRSLWGAGPRKLYYPADGRSFYTGFKYSF